MVDAWLDLLMQKDGPLKRLHATWPTLVNDEFRETLKAGHRSTPGRGLCRPFKAFHFVTSLEA